jgi:hypothetical protein
MLSLIRILLSLVDFGRNYSEFKESNYVYLVLISHEVMDKSKILTKP